jgi:hypothetical protein
MVALYRVLPHLAGVRRGRPGHPLFVPRSTGSNRVDNPGRYDTFYVGDTAAGAVAEAFGWVPRWNAGMLRGTPSLPGSMRALAHYELPGSAAVCDLDDAHRLVALALRPSQVVTRDRAATQAWALALFEQGLFAGVRWWSYYDPRWGSYGLWEHSGLALTGVEALTLAHPAVTEAADVLVRPLL